MENPNDSSSSAGFKPYQLKAFLAVAEHASIRAAAKALFISQPAITRTIRELELELDVPLVVRGTRGVELTSYGQAFEVRARLLMAESRRAREELAQIKSGLNGQVCISVSSLPAMLLLPPAFLAFRQRMPDAQLHCIDGHLMSALPALRNGQLDFMLTQLPQPSQEADLCHERLFTSTLVIGARVGHPRLRSRSLATLKNEEWIGSDRALIEDLFKSHQLPVPARILNNQSFEVARSLVERTDLLCLFSAPIVEHELVRHGIRCIHVKEQLPALSVFVITRRNAKLTPSAQSFLELIRAAAAPFRAD